MQAKASGPSIELYTANAYGAINILRTSVTARSIH
ncbi:hypothetical protein BMETH_396_3 [methanotrophic bacterial endosymbiont of Bathymodiolus sp.]|nr:hypothetical protein BMETH_396_3 [methanotrophic bacterial endosymbiont of Bathymodiolus sp.]